MDRGDWQATVHGATKSWTQLSTYTSLYKVSNFPKPVNVTCISVVIIESIQLWKPMKCVYEESFYKTWLNHWKESIMEDY